MNTGPDEPPAAAGGAKDGAAGGGVEYRAVFPAAAGAVPAVRDYVRAAAGGDGAPGELELVASELASCAVRAAAGQTFIVTTQRGPGWLRVEVAMPCSGWWPADPDGGDGADAVAYACGLALVAALADRFGHQGSAGGTAVLWAEVSTSNGRAAGDHDKDAWEPL